MGIFSAMIKRTIWFIFLALLMAMPDGSFASENVCPYEKAWKDEYLSFNEKNLAQTQVILGILGRLQAINDKAVKHEGEKDNGLSKKEGVEDTELSIQIN